MSEIIKEVLSEVLREKTTKVLAKNLGCTEEIAKGILEGMDKEAKETKALFEECAAEMD